MAAGPSDADCAEDGVHDEAFWSKEPETEDLWGAAAPCAWASSDLVAAALRALGVAFSPGGAVFLRESVRAELLLRLASPSGCAEHGSRAGDEAAMKKEKKEKKKRKKREEAEAAANPGGEEQPDSSEEDGSVKKRKRRRDKDEDTEAAGKGHKEKKKHKREKE